MLNIHDLHFSYGQHAVLNGLSYELFLGEIVGFVGDNGAGKTTTLSIISGLIRPQQGTVEWKGTSIWSENSSYRSEFGYVPAIAPLFKNATVRENLEYTAKLRRLPLTTVTTVLDELQLLEIQHQKVSSLSTGWRQWVGIAQGWIHRPLLLILDEPTAGLDPSSRLRFEQWTQQLKSNGHTLFFSSHIIREVEAISDRILQLENGQITQSNQSSHTIQCIVVNLDSQILEQLKMVDGIKQIDVSENQLRLHCTKDCRVDIATILVNSGLLEMRRI